MSEANRKCTLYSNVYLYKYINDHAKELNLPNTRSALPFMRSQVADYHIQENTFHHSLMMCRMMIDLNMDLTKREEDILLAAAICHTLPEEKQEAAIETHLREELHLDDKVIEIVRMIYKLETAPEEQLPMYYDQIQRNKLALLITICDRGNMVEQLHGKSSWQVRRFIHETKAYYLPMCIYAKEHYTELLSPIGILAEKMRNLTDVSEILMVRFEAKELELSHEILALREENATIRGLIAKMEHE